MKSQQPPFRPSVIALACRRMIFEMVFASEMQR